MPCLTWIDRRYIGFLNNGLPLVAALAITFVFSGRAKADNVDATVSGSVLTIQGDADENNIEITGGPNPGEILVQGVGTTINGATNPVAFSNINEIYVELDAGNDQLHVDNLLFCTDGFTYMRLNGGLGDDEIKVTRTKVFESSGENLVRIGIYGEILSNYSGPIGNDTILVEDTHIEAAEGGNPYALFNIYGESNDSYCNVTGGDDTICVTRTTLHTNGTSTANTNRSYFLVLGEYNLYFNQQFGGNDQIELSDISVTAEGGYYNTEAFFYVAGTYNLNGNTIVGSNDQITISDVQIHTEGGILEGESSFVVNGGYNESNNTIFGGDDSISVSNIEVTANGGNWAVPTFSIFGESLNSGFGQGNSQWGGNDQITVSNIQVNATNGNYVSQAYFEILGDYAWQSSYQEGGNDIITVDDLTVSAQGGVYDDRASLTIFGDRRIDYNICIGGNDEIRLTNIHLSVQDGINNNAAQIEIYGDRINSYNVQEGGDDLISIDGLWAETRQGYFDNSSTMYIAGDYRDYYNQVIGGNDVVRVTNFEFSSIEGTYEDFSQVIVIGEYNYYGNDLTGGNDDIHVSNGTLFSAGGQWSGTHASELGLWGDSLAQGYNTLVGGNDKIKATNVNVVSYNHIYQGNSNLNIRGDYVGTGSLIMGGNDDIRVANCLVTSIDSQYYNYAYCTLYGEYNLGTVEGGNDTIKINATELVASGSFYNSFAYVEVFADRGRTVGGGNDQVDVQNVSISAGSNYFYDAYAYLNIYADYNNPNPGNDTIRIANCLADAANGQGNVYCYGGNDKLLVTNSDFDVFQGYLSNGDDEVQFLNNRLTNYGYLDGGPGNDSLKSSKLGSNVTTNSFEK